MDADQSPVPVLASLAGSGRVLDLRCLGLSQFLTGGSGVSGPDPRVSVGLVPTGLYHEGGALRPGDPDRVV